MWNGLVVRRGLSGSAWRSQLRAGGGALTYMRAIWQYSPNLGLVRLADRLVFPRPYRGDSHNVDLAFDEPQDAVGCCPYLGQEDQARSAEFDGGSPVTKLLI